MAFGTRTGLQGFADVATAARNLLDDLDEFAVLILHYMADEDVTLITAVGRLLGENFGGFGTYTCGVHSCLLSGCGPGPGR
jgi:hypothetical protein